MGFFGAISGLRIKISSITLGGVGLICLFVFALPWSPSTQPSGFSLTLDLDDAAGDQSVSSLDLLPNQLFVIQIFGRDIQGATGISARFRIDASQVAYEGFDAGDALPNAQAVAQPDTTSVRIGVSWSSGSATVNTGLVGTLRLRTTPSFSDTEVWLEHAELTRGGQTETISPAAGVALQVAAPPSPDFDGDGVVGFSDFVAFAGVFGSQRGDGKYVAAYDLTQDGGIGFDDFLVFASNFGKNPNRAPAFDATPPLTRTMEENTPSGQPIGAPVTATDADGNSLTYGLRGVHSDSFAIEPGTGQLLTREGTAYDHEARDSYSVTVRASDGQGGRATVVVGISVSDVDEPPSAAPDSVRVASRDTALAVTWFAAMDEAGKPPVSGYEVGHNPAEAQEWREGLLVVGRTDTSVTIAGLDNERAYQVRVRTVNEEGASPWSETVAGAPTVGPRPLGVIGDLTVVVDRDLPVNLASLFTRPALGALTYDATSSDEGVATVTVADTMATVRGVAAGRATITATASDVQGKSAQTTFAVDVTTALPPPPQNNRPPTFDDGRSASRTLAENTPAHRPIQHPVNATDPDGHRVTYRLSGPDSASFSVATGSGQLRTLSGITYDFEDNDRYSVDLVGSDPYGESATIGVTIHVADVDEPPEIPAAPQVQPASTTSLTVTWDAPDNTGPDITDYDVQYRKSGNFLPHTHDGPGTSATIIDLDVNTRYEVQVRAHNDEGEGGWSGSGFGTTSSNLSPVFDEGRSTTREVAENTTGVQNLGVPLRADDPENTAVTYSLTRGDMESFDIDENTGQLRTSADATYDFETKDRYSVTVEAQDEQGGRATIAVTIDVTDDDSEAPEAPDKPTVTAQTLNSLSIRWTAPANTGPAITDYDVQYRKSGNFLPHTHDGPGTSATIIDLDVNTRYEVQVRAHNDEGEGGWSGSGFGTTSSNLSPVFDEGRSTTREVAENTTGVHNLGVPLRANDPENTAVTYSLTRGDMESFDIDENTGQLRTSADATYDFETKDRYSVTVEAQDEQGGRATIAVTIDVTDDDSEAPEAPDKPTVTAQTLNSLSIRWTAPANTGPAINDYDVQFSEDGGAFTDWPHTGPGTTTTITSLTADTPYRVQVLARSPEGESDWSESADARTVANRAPTFNEGTSTARALVENTTGTNDIGNPLTARDIDGGTLTYDLEGTDQAAFALDGAQLETQPGVTYDFEAKPRYDVIVRVEDGQGGSNTIAVRINLTDQQERPGTPDAPSVSAASSTSLEVTWDEPANTGPDINDYDVQYREGDSGGFTSWTHNSAERTATITGRTPGTSYQVQVLARSPEGTSDWSESGTGSTDPNQLPTFTDGLGATRTVAENTTGVKDIGDPVGATDPEMTPLTYALEGTHADSFSIDTRSGQLKTRSGRTYDFEALSRYSVNVKATDGHGGEGSIPVSIDLTDLNEAPVFTGEPTLEATENQSFAGRVSADDLDQGDAITDYTLTGGSDRSRLEISNTGALTFRDDPDFERPVDAGSNNSYVVEVTATGGSGGRALTAAQTVTVNVTDENEPPVFTIEDTFKVTENTRFAGLMVAQDVDAGDAITGYAVTGAADGDLFEIASTNQLRFKEDPDFETPADAGSNNDYSVVVEATGGSGTREMPGTKTVVVLVKDDVEPPGKPDPPTVSGETESSLTVSWDAPENQGPDITNYYVQYREGASGAFSNWHETGPTRSRTITGLRSGRICRIQVQAENDEGKGPWSDQVYGTILPASIVPSSTPVFTAAPDEDHRFGQPVTHAFSGDHTSTLDPGDHNRTHVEYDDGTLEPATGTAGINITNKNAGSEYHAITIGDSAEVTARGSVAANITTEGNTGNLWILNQGSVTLDSAGIGIRAVMKASPANILLVNDGEITLNGLTTAPDSAQSNHRLVVGGLNKAAEPHDFSNYSHKVELFNMPGGQLIATGPYNKRVDGLKCETGSGHLTRLVNYAEGQIRIEGEGARGISAQSLWGASQGLNFGSIEINGLYAIGLHTGNCAPWPFENNGCHGNLDEIVPDRTSNVPGDVYARNYSDASITTRATTRTDDTRRHRHGYGIIARSSMSGRVFAINQGTIDTEGKWSHGIYAYGYDNDRDLDDTSYPDIPDYPDTSEHDGVHVENTGTISTDGEAAHGIRAEHYRGGEIKVFNTGNILATNKYSTNAESSYSAGISIAGMGGDVPGPGCETAAGDPVDPDIVCKNVYRIGDVVVWNSGDIGAPEGVTEAPSIGIDVVSQGGDITITHTGSITAARIGIRVQTSGQGKITLNASGALNAPMKYEVIGGTDNEIVVNEL